MYHESTSQSHDTQERDSESAREQAREEKGQNRSEVGGIEEEAAEDPECGEKRRKKGYERDFQSKLPASMLGPADWRGKSGEERRDWLAVPPMQPRLACARRCVSACTVGVHA
ncbi:hypothetical protein KM043_013318 [Ampulex compressa]|nr:hypothetical protein KM043_013318 [Ampulex compressa]